jgi:hypothetical protein
MTLSIALANRLIGWTRASYSSLTPRQWLVGFGVGSPSTEKPTPKSKTARFARAV